MMEIIYRIKMDSNYQKDINRNKYNKKIKWSLNKQFTTNSTTIKADSMNQTKAKEIVPKRSPNNKIKYNNRSPSLKKVQIANQNSNKILSQ